MGTVTKGLITKSDLYNYDGVNRTLNRIDSTGGTNTQLAVNDYVDLLPIYGSDVNARNEITITKALRKIGTKEAQLLLGTGNWTIASNTIIPDNIDLLIPKGTTITVASGVTLTHKGTLSKGNYNPFLGDGTVSYNSEEWILYGEKPTQTSATTFTISGDKTAIFKKGTKLKFNDSSTLYGVISSSAYTTVTTVTVILSSGSLTSSLSSVLYGSNIGSVANIYDLGADNTGNVDCTTLVNSLAAAFKTIYAPEGDYLISGANGLVLNTWNKLIGDGKDLSRIFCAEDSDINLVTTATISNVSGEYDQKIEISNITLDHNRSSAMTTQLYMTLLLVGCRNVLCKNVNFNNPNTDSVYINYEYGGTGHSDNQPKNIRFIDCDFNGSNINRNGISVISGRRIKIRGCNFVNLCKDDMPGAIDLEPNNSTNLIDGVEINDCDFEGCKASIVSDYSPNNSSSYIKNINISDINIYSSSAHTTTVPTEFFGHTGIAMAHATSVNMQNINIQGVAHAAFWFADIVGLNMSNISGISPTSPMIIRDTYNVNVDNFYLETTNSTTFTSVVSNGIYLRYETTGAGHPGVRRGRFTNGTINCSDGTPTTNSAILGEGNIQDIDIDNVHLMGGWANGVVRSNGSSGDALRWSVNVTIEDGNSMTPVVAAFDGAITDSGDGPWVIPGVTNGVETFSAATSAVITIGQLAKLATAQMKVSAVDNQGTIGISAKRTSTTQFTITASSSFTGDVYWELAHP